MSSIYEDHRDEDGFLYITYSGENTFGAFEEAEAEEVVDEQHEHEHDVQQGGRAAAHHQHHQQQHAAAQLHAGPGA